MPIFTAEVALYIRVPACYTWNENEDVVVNCMLNPTLPGYYKVRDYIGPDAQGHMIHYRPYGLDQTYIYMYIDDVHWNGPFDGCPEGDYKPLFRAWPSS